MRSRRDVHPKLARSISTESTKSQDSVDEFVEVHKYERESKQRRSSTYYEEQPLSIQFLGSGQGFEQCSYRTRQWKIEHSCEQTPVRASALRELNRLGPTILICRSTNLVSSIVGKIVTTIDAQRLQLISD